MKPAVYFYPVAIVYGWIISLRNFLFDKGIISSRQCRVPVICVGNLAAGGTGKTPMVIYLVQHLIRAGLRPGIVTRGYKRKGHSVFIAGKSDPIELTGDEPAIFISRLDVPVAIGKNRLKTVDLLLKLHPGLDVIVMDDGFQHRRIKAGLNLILTAANRPFYSDRLLPAGYLREPASSLKRAQAVIVTKMTDQSPETKKNMTDTIRKVASCPVLFSSLKYGVPLHAFTGKELNENTYGWSVLAFSGIADSSLFEQQCRLLFRQVEFLTFPNHYRYTPNDFKTIVSRFDNIASDRKLMVTTEKDMVKLKAEKSLAGRPLYYLPAEADFDSENLQSLAKLIDEYARKNK